MRKIIENDGIIFSTNQAKLEILKSLNTNSKLYNIAFFDIDKSLTKFSNRYYFYLQDNYDLSVDLADQLKKYFDYIDLQKKYTSSKLNYLKRIKQDLINNNIIRIYNIDKYQSQVITAINNMPVPYFFYPKEVQQTKLNPILKSKLKLYKAKSQIQSIFSVYERVISLLESGIDISDIVILNSTLDDDFYLKKIFNDANLPIYFNKKIKLNTYPKIISLLRILKKEGYSACKEFIAKTIENDRFLVLNKAISNIFNNYLDEDLIKHPDIFVDIINNATFSLPKYSGCINVYDFDDFIYQEGKHYLLMNYIDSSLPKKINFIGYLNKDDLEELNYIGEDKYNLFLKENDMDILNSVKYLDLFFYSNIDSENNRIPDFNLKREIISLDYSYQVKNRTYLNSLNQLEYAKAKYDLDTYYLENTNYNELYPSYKEKVLIYRHKFTGINISDLKLLLIKNNSLTGAKIESYYKCEFQFLIGYLLKLDIFETNMQLYLGNLSHKVLEEFTNDLNIDYYQLIDNFPGFPEEEKYKEFVYKEAIKKEMDYLLPLIKEFHNHSLFKEIKTEFSFKFPFSKNPNFYISGKIDKLMIYSNQSKVSYLAVIDYKFSDKKFEQEKFTKALQLQLPVYLYAYKEVSKEKIQPMGFYYQKTSLGRYKNEKNVILNNFKLQGISLRDKSVLNAFNEDMTLLKGIKLKNDGSFNSNSLNNTVDELAMNEILNLVEDFIEKAINKIEKGSFRINPLNSYGKKKDSVSCEYCKFFNICYNKNKNLGVGK